MDIAELLLRAGADHTARDKVGCVMEIAFHATASSCLPQNSGVTNVKQWHKYTCAR